MSKYLGDFVDNSTVHFAFTTNAADGGRESFSATIEEADIVIFKDGSAMTLDASTITITSEPGSRTGVHLVSVDMNNDADFATGSDYVAILYASDETLDSQAPAGVLAQWSCENRTVDARAISGSSTAADNAEIVFATDFATNYNTTNDKWQVEADTTSISGDSTAADNLEAAFDGTGYDLGGIDVSELNGIVDDLLDAGRLDALIDAIKAKTDSLTFTVSNQVDANTLQIEGADATDQVNAACDAAIETYGLDHLISASVTGTDIADDSIIAQMVSSSATADWDDFVNTDDSLQAISESGGGGPTAAAIADAVWDEAQSGHVSAGSFGEIATEIASILVDTAEIGTAGAGLTAIAWNSAWDAEVQSECNDALVALGLDHLVGSSVTGTDVVDNSIIAKLVSKEATADWDDFVNTTDSLQATRDAITTAQTDLDTITGADGVNLLSATQASIDAIEADTNELQGDWVNGGRLDLIIDELTTQGDTNETKLDAAQTDLDTITDTGVTCVAITTAAFTDIWATDTLTEAYAADGAAATPAQAVYLIMQHLGESSIAGTTKTVKKLDGSTSAATFTLDDGSSPTSITRAT